MEHVRRVHWKFVKSSIQENDAHSSYKAIAIRNTQEPAAHYLIVTLNYDLVPEVICEFINSNFAQTQGGNRVSFIDSTNPQDPFAPSLSKLHGSIDRGNIVPPTWNKSNNPDIVPAWKLAYELLEQANHIRIIGYSLPIADAYVKYLLKSAVVSNEHLKWIDVICLDPDGSVKGRYDDFISLHYYCFFNRSTSEYLAIVRANSYGEPDELSLNKLEIAHRSFTNR